MEDWNAYRRRQRAVATAKRQAETGFKRGPCPTHAARMKAFVSRRHRPGGQARGIAAPAAVYAHRTHLHSRQERHALHRPDQIIMGARLRTSLTQGVAVESAHSSDKPSLPSLSLGSGPGRPLLGLFKSSSGTLGIWNGQHEAHFVRRGPIGTNVSLLR